MSQGLENFDAIYGGEHAEAERPIWTSIKRGLSCRCPNCGEGKLFSSFTKTVENCGHCGEEIHHHRADDMPAYLNLFVVGHIVVAGFLMVERSIEMSHWAHLAIWVPLTLLLTLLLLQPIKGLVVALQWALRMHGFGGQPDQVADASIDPTLHG